MPAPTKSAEILREPRSAAASWSHSQPLTGRVARIIARLDEVSVGFRLRMPDGAEGIVGSGQPRFTVHAMDRAGLHALLSLHQLRIADAYIEGHVDFEGDFVAAMSVKYLLSDRSPWIKTWRRIAPLLFGRERLNPAWVARHYDSDNIQLIAADRDYNTYTPGIYEGATDTLEAGARRKLATAFDALRLRSGERVLDVGCGWGGFLRYAGRRNVHVTGITLSRNQFAHDQRLIAREALPAEVLYHDFFTYEPDEQFDGIVIMGVIEELSDYRHVIRRLLSWLRPGRRVYLDFGAAPMRVATGSFISKHVWPGTFRMVYMPELIEAVDESPFEVAELHNDRVNYHLWSKCVHDRWVNGHDEVVEQADESTWRRFRILYASCAMVMARPAGNCSAYRLVLELPGVPSAASGPPSIN